MQILKVTDEAFRQYGKVIKDLDVSDIITAMSETPCPDDVVYEPSIESLEACKSAQSVSDSLYGGMPIQIGYCNGHNHLLNAVEYHRDSEFNLGLGDFILLLAKQDEIEDGVLDTAKVKAFKVPAGVMVEVYATTLHYAPCHADAKKGFRVMVALPDQTNTDFRPEDGANKLDKTLWARNKWLLAHPDSSEAKQGAAVLLKGENIDIAGDI